MRRTAVWLALGLTLNLFAGLLPLQTARAQLLADTQSLTGVQSLTAQLAGNKASAEIIRKVNNGQGADRVRVIVMPKGSWPADLDLTLLSYGASDFRTLQNFNFHILSLPAGAAAAIAQRSDVDFVALNKEVRTLGHVSFTSGVKRFGLSNEGVDFAVDQYNEKLLSPDVRKTADELKKEIIAGKIKVPDYYVEGARGSKKPKS